MKINIDGKEWILKFHHKRNLHLESNRGSIITDITIAILKDEDIRIEGSSYCMKGDQFRKEYGRRKALIRCLSNGKFSRDQKQQAFQQYESRRNPQPRAPKNKIEHAVKKVYGADKASAVLKEIFTE